MPINVDKALLQAPPGIETLAEDETAIEIEIVPDGITPLEAVLDPETPGFNDNLAETLPDKELGRLVSELDHLIEEDINGRKDWEKTYREGLKLLGLTMEERTEPWSGACGVFHPMITEAAVKFQAELITETFPAQGPVKAKIIGKETTEVKEAALRVENDMNYELTERMQEFRPEHERMLFSLPTTGSAFKKVIQDDTLGRQTSTFIPAEDVILPYGTTDMGTCYRVTHVLRKPKNELLKLMKSGFYRTVDLPEQIKQSDEIKDAKDKESGYSDINDERYVLHEVHADLIVRGGKWPADAPELEPEEPVENADGSITIDMDAEEPKAEVEEDEDDDGDEIAVPYVLTYIRGTNTVLGIRRNWREEDTLHLKRQHFVHYQYIPGFGAYGFGLFHLIGGYAKSATSILRQLVDSGTLSNLPGGLKTRGLRIKGDDTPIAPGEFRDVDVGSGTIQQNIMTLPYKEPSVVLAGLLEKIIEEGRRFAATADMKVSDMSAQAPVGTILALLERQLKVLTAVQARVHFSLKQELKLLKEIIRDNTDDEYEYDPAYGPRTAKQADYDMVDVIPVSDPNAATMSQRVVQHQAVIQMAQMAPDIYDLPQLHRSMLEVLGIKNAAKIVPLPDDQKPQDPVTENQSLLSGSPVKAFLHQDHAAHLAVHSMMMADPTIAQSIGQNPRAPMIQGSLMAHMAEHTGFQMRQKIEQQLGMPLPPQGEPLPPSVEIALSALMARAAAQVVQQSQQQAAQQQAAEQAKDPIIQMQQRELEISAEKVGVQKSAEQRKAQEAAARQRSEDQKSAAQIANEREALRIEAERVRDQRAKDQAQLKLDYLALRQKQADGADRKQSENRKSRAEVIKALNDRRKPTDSKLPGGDQ